MGCMSCNPFCGKCRPPHPKPVVCKACGRLVMRGRYEKWVCPRCGAALQWLRKEAEQRQILLFTCHSREAAFFSGDPAVSVQKLG